MKRYLLIFGLYFFILPLKAQRNYLSLGGSVGTFQFLEKDRYWAFPSGQGSIILHKQTAGRLAFGGSLSYMYVKMQAPEPFAYQFRNQIPSFNLWTELNIFSGDDHMTNRNNFNLFIIGGGSIFYHFPQISIASNGWQSLDSRVCGCQNYRQLGFGVFGGLGIKFKVNEYWDLRLKTLYNYTFSDNLSIPIIYRITDKTQKNNSFLSLEVGLSRILVEKQQRKHPKIPSHTSGRSREKGSKPHKSKKKDKDEPSRRENPELKNDAIRKPF